MVRRGASVCPAASVASRRMSSAGQARSGFTWSAVTGETPPQSSMPASSSGPSSSERLGGACTWISGGSTRRAAAMAQCRSSGGQGAALNMAVPALGRKFWTMTSCTCPWRACEAAMARSAASWSARVVADADEDAGGEGDGQLAGGLQGGQPAGGLLVGRPPVGVEALGQRLEHHPLAGRHRAQRGQLAGIERAGVGVGEQAGLLQHEAAHGGEVVHRRGVALRGQPLRRHRVAQLGPLAQGEEGLVAAGGPAGLGDGQHLLGQQVRAR